IIDMRFEVLERSGEGALFEVFKSRDKTSGRVVAVKSLQQAFRSDVRVSKALRSAAAGLVDHSHPNVSRVFEVGEEGGAPFLVTEFVRGIDLKERIRRIAPFTLSVAVDFAIAVAEALQYCHAQGVIHGDLIPRNIIVTPEG